MNNTLFPLKRFTTVDVWGPLHLINKLFTTLQRVCVVHAIRSTRAAINISLVFQAKCISRVSAKDPRDLSQTTQTIPSDVYYQLCLSTHQS